jgi:hypothetical protein
VRPVEDGLEIKPGESVTLKPSSLHVMLMDIKHPLEQGKTVEATPAIREGWNGQGRIPGRGDRSFRAGCSCGRRHDADG